MTSDFFKNYKKFTVRGCIRRYNVAIVAYPRHYAYYLYQATGYIASQYPGIAVDHKLIIYRYIVRLLHH